VGVNIWKTRDIGLPSYSNNLSTGCKDIELEEEGANYPPQREREENINYVSLKSNLVRIREVSYYTSPSALPNSWN
jgi:hypothetical protein